MKKIKIPAIVIMLLLVANTYAADTVVSSAVPVGTQAQLDALTAQNALLTLQLKNMELQNKINGGSAAPAPKISLSHDDKFSGSESSGPDAKVVLVSGEQGHAVATILLDGAQIKVREGMTVSGLGTVVAITLDEVVVKRGKRAFALPFVADMTSAPVGAGMNGGMMGGMPPMPSGGMHP